MQAFTHLPPWKPDSTVMTNPSIRVSSTHFHTSHWYQKCFLIKYNASPCAAHSTSNRSHPLLLTVSNTFNSLFKVLFTFPSRYLCSIGLLRIFSFGRNLPPVKIALPSNPTLGKQSVRGDLQTLNGAITLLGATFQWTLVWAALWTCLHKLQFALVEPVRLPAWAFPGSLAVTKGILFSFFSSAYLYA